MRSATCVCTWIMLLLVSACSGSGQDAGGSTPDTPPAVPLDCDRACLEDFLDRNHDPLVAGARIW